MTLPQLEPSHHVLPSHEFGTKQEMLSEISQGEDPLAVMLTCWELGGTPDQVSHARPGEIMVVQNPGGLLRGAEMPDDGRALDTVYYALGHATVRHIIVCGHTECKTLGMFVSQASKKNEMDAYCKLADCVRERFMATYKERPPKEWLRIIAQENVLQQLANLRSHKDILSRLNDGSVVLHGWLRDDEASVISTYNPEIRQFCD
jgi:carbonic anhydrase